MEPTAPTKRYEILGELGAGGMGRILRARDARLGREVALKRLLPSLATDPLAVERFLREARTAAAFSHPNAVHVYDVDRDEEGPFIAMELVRGQSLAERLKAGPLSPREAIRVIRQVGAALAAAHAAGILHRDVKPSNVLLDEQGSARLSDFGLALFEGRGELTRSLVGTPEYMAPEQAGDPSKVDARADVFSLAATLYACLTGEPPRVVRESRIPAALRPALLGALAQRPEDRCPSMEAFLKALESASGGRARRARALFILKLVGAAGATASVVSVAYTLLRPMAQRTVAPVAISLPTRPVAAIPPATAAGRVAPAPRVAGTFVEVQVHKTVIDAGYAQGFVVNTGEAPLERAHVLLQFFDEKGALVLDASGYAAADRIEPGARYPVSVLLKPHPRYARFEARVESEQNSFAQPSARLETLEKQLAPQRFGGWLLTAKVRNADSVAASFPHVTAVLYDADGKVSGMQDGFLSARTLKPGEASTASFEVDAFGAQPARFELYLFGAVER